MYLAKLGPLRDRTSGLYHHGSLLDLQEEETGRLQTSEKLERLCYYTANEHTISGTVITVLNVKFLLSSEFSFREILFAWLPFCISVLNPLMIVLRMKHARGTVRNSVVYLLGFTRDMLYVTTSTPHSHEQAKTRVPDQATKNLGSASKDVIVELKVLKDIRVDIKV